MISMGEGHQPRLARTVDEAHTFMDLRPCACGANRFERTHRLVSTDDDLISEYRGACASCGEMRQFRFRLSHDLAPAVDNRYGSGRSELLDAGEWLFVADRMSASVPSRVPTAAEDRERAAHRLRVARDAVEQALNLSNADGVLPPTALTSSHSRQLLAKQPTRFEPARLRAIRDAYESELARYAG